MLLGDSRQSLSGNSKVARARNVCPVHAVWMSSVGLTAVNFIVHQSLKDLRNSCECEKRLLEVCTDNSNTFQSSVVIAVDFRDVLVTWHQRSRQLRSREALLSGHPLLTVPSLSQEPRWLSYSPDRCHLPHFFTLLKMETSVSRGAWQRLKMVRHAEAVFHFSSLAWRTLEKHDDALVTPQPANQNVTPKTILLLVATLQSLLNPVMLLFSLPFHLALWLPSTRLSWS